MTNYMNLHKFVFVGIILLSVVHVVLAECENSTNPGLCEFKEALSQGAKIVKPELKVYNTSYAYYPKDANKEWDRYLEEKKNEPGYTPPPAQNYKPRIVNITGTIQNITVRPVPPPKESGFVNDESTSTSSCCAKNNQPHTSNQSYENNTSRNLATEQQKQQNQTDILSAIINIVFSILKSLI